MVLLRKPRHSSIRFDEIGKNAPGFYPGCPFRLHSPRGTGTLGHTMLGLPGLSSLEGSGFERRLGGQNPRPFVLLYKKRMGPMTVKLGQRSLVCSPLASRVQSWSSLQSPPSFSSPATGYTSDIRNFLNEGV